jgi:N-acetylglucosaminyl-diphospho-decaprenol L-rhamnosyltransferase
MRATFVILTRDRWPRLRETVERLRAEHPGVPVVVVDNGSSDPPGAIAGAELVRCERDRGAAARNLGVEVVQTPLVAFCDDDAWWQAGAIETAAARFAADARLGGVVGRVLVEPGARLDPVSATHEREGRVTGFQSTALVIRRAAFTEVGGFHERFRIGGEEELLAMQLLSAGWRLDYEPRAVLHHAPVARQHHTRQHRPLTGPRNALWTAWLRRPLPVAVRETARIVRGGAPPRAVAQAARGLPWVLRERKINPPEVERLYARG